ncbi:DUF5979 domain-containing protein [Corynebacterium sp. H130]|uniref:DUF5979 domain-containing protein n=1 Tax=Corynebacterium sp. H130 TaxID=3133444 RepID=UPI00309B9703
MNYSKKMQRVLAFFAVLFFVFGGLVVPNNPFSLPAPKAEAQVTGSQYNMGDCNFRKGTGSLASLGQQLCWIDWTGFQLYRDKPQTITKKIGRYTLTFTMRVVNTDVNSTIPLITGTDTPSFQPERAVFANPSNIATLQALGTDTFLPYNNFDSKPILDFANRGAFNERDLMFNMENITIKDENGKVVPNYSIMMMDAANTYSGSTGELISMENREGSVGLVKTVTPAGFIPACSNTAGQTGAIYGVGTEPVNEWGSSSGGRVRDFICYPRGYKTTDIAKPGSYIVTAKSPKNLEFGTYTASTGFQSIALAIDLGRLAGALEPVDTSYEQAATGQSTSFDFNMYDRIGTTDTPVPSYSGQYTTQLRTLDAGGTVLDSYVFKSVASGADAQKALERYEPIWTCVLNDATTQTIRAGTTPPSGFTLTNKPDSSELVFTNPDNVPVKCNVTWEPRFEPAAVSLTKNVTGTARQFDDVIIRTYNMRYTCQDANGFSTAYPGIPLTGVIPLMKGESKTTTKLPQGLQCTLTEEFPADQPNPGPGETHTLTWTGGNQSADSLPSVSKVLTAENSLVATNNYDYREGTLTLSKELVGDPMGELPEGTSRPYQFEITCSGTSYQNQNVQLDIVRTGTIANGSIQIPGIPVDRDCTVKPLTGLSDAESKVVKFDGRDVTFNGASVPKNADGSYSFKLPDYPAGGTPSTSEMHIVANYSYQLRDVKVIKELAGPAASNPTLVKSDFTMSYRCTWGSALPKEATGTLTVNADPLKNSAVIPGIPVSADCIIYESGLPTVNEVILDKTTLKSADQSDTITELTNEQAQTTPILKVSNSTDAAQNRVLVTNTYSPKLGTVQLNKQVNTNGITGSLPNTFSFTFDCGSRSVVRPDGTIGVVRLVGDVTVDGGSSTTLQLNSADGALVNDQAGSLGVPYGNTCTFTEKAPDSATYSGVVWDADDENASLQVQAPTNTATVTNTFTPLGQGLTIKQYSQNHVELQKDVTYSLTCNDALGAPIDLGANSTLTLSSDNSTLTIPSANLPKGATCELSETSTDDRTRALNNGTTGSFPITRFSTVRYEEDTTTTPVTSSFDNTQNVVATFTIGDQSILAIDHSYDYVRENVSATKNVVFDPATEKFISDARKQIKRERDFAVTMSCVGPLGGNPTIVSGTVSSVTGALDFGTHEVGSRCTATELSTTTADGVSVKQEVTAGGSTAERTVDFTIASGENPVVFTNTFARILGDVFVKKTAQLPGSIQAQYDQAGQLIPFHTHNFTMECHDPETGTGDAGALLGTFTSTIYGPSDTTFHGVPVGADCKLTGDQFGQLNLSLTDANGDPLTANLRPKQVRWVVDKNDGTAFVDTDLADGETTSQYFRVIANSADGAINNEVELVNTYDYIKTKIKMTKEFVGKPGDLALLTDATAVDFSLQCKGVGYTYSNIGMDGDQLDPTLEMPQFGEVFTDANGNEVRKYASPEVTVPTGALCNFEEIETRNLPQELTNTPNPKLIVKAASTSEWVDASSPVESYDFVNSISRNTTPVGVSLTHDGLISAADPAGYNVTVTCNDPSQTKQTQTLSKDAAAIGRTVSSPSVPPALLTFDLPVGATCSFDLNGSPALAANPLLEVTAGDRRPFTQFNSWQGGTMQRTDLSKLSDATAVDDSYKSYTYDFTIPSDAPSDQSVVVVAAETYFQQDKVDVAFTKEAVGYSGTGTSFTFTEHCSGTEQTFSLQAGEQYVIPNVPVMSTCNVTETDDGVAEYDAMVSVSETGALINNTRVQEVVDPELQAKFSTVLFDVGNVTTASDLTTAGPSWSLTALNTFPGMEVVKTIDGSPLSSITGGIADLALIPHTQDTMRFNYTVNNTGAFDLRDLKIVERGLAGMTVIVGGTEVLIDDTGTIPASVCSISGTTVTPGQSTTCSFDVKIPAPHTENFYYTPDDGQVFIEAQSDAGIVSTSDNYGAFRPMDSVAWLLPETGMQTLVYVLLLGLLILGYGLYRWKRERDEEEQE